MRHGAARLLVAALWSSGLMVAAIAAPDLTAAPAAVDCGPAPSPQEVGAQRGIAFIGRVAASEPVGLQYSVMGGETSGSRVFWASQLSVGDRVLISFQPPTDEDRHDLAQDTHVAWRALVWRPTGDGEWRFADNAMLDPEGHPDVARAAHSLPETLMSVGPGLPPPTRTWRPQARAATNGSCRWQAWWAGRSVFGASGAAPA